MSLIYPTTYSKNQSNLQILFSTINNPSTLFTITPTTQLETTTTIKPDFIKNNIKPFKGTTTLSFIFQEGIVIAVDSRASTGQYIASQSVLKVIEINKHLLGTMAGGAADCLFWEKLMGVEAKRFELKNNKRITARAASKYLSDCVFQYAGRGLSLGSLISGYDESGPGLYYVDDNGRLAVKMPMGIFTAKTPRK